jgi:hypothetical protein
VGRGKTQSAWYVPTNWHSCVPELRVFMLPLKLYRRLEEQYPKIGLDRFRMPSPVGLGMRLTGRVPTYLNCG